MLSSKCRDEFFAGRKIRSPFRRAPETVRTARRRLLFVVLEAAPDNIAALVNDFLEKSIRRLTKEPRAHPPQPTT